VLFGEGACGHPVGRGGPEEPEGRDIYSRCSDLRFLNFDKYPRWFDLVAIQPSLIYVHFTLANEILHTHVSYGNIYGRHP
jgi:hypothetical protein